MPKADEVKEEIYSNLLDKYNGLLEKGVSEQEAYENIKNSVGDVDELIQSIKEENAGYGNVYTDEEIKNIKKKVFIDALSLFLYICSVVVLLGMISIYENGVGVISFLIIVAAASAMRYYTYKVFRDDYTQKSQTNKETVNTPLTEEEAAKAAKEKKNGCLYIGYW